MGDSELSFVSSVLLKEGKRIDLSKNEKNLVKSQIMLWGSVKEGGLPNNPHRKIIREDSMGSLDVSSFSSDSNDSSYGPRRTSHLSDIFPYLDEETQDAVFTKRRTNPLLNLYHCWPKKNQVAVSFVI